MPAFSVSTWKLITCRPLITATLTNFASSQPTMRMTIASSSFGKNSPSCTRKTRTGSNAGLTCSMGPPVTFDI